MCAAKSLHAAHSFLSRIGARITRLVAPFDGPSWVTSTGLFYPSLRASTRGQCRQMRISRVSEHLTTGITGKADDGELNMNSRPHHDDAELIVRASAVLRARGQKTGPVGDPVPCQIGKRPPAQKPKRESAAGLDIRESQVEGKTAECKFNVGHASWRPQVKSRSEPRTHGACTSS